MFVTENPINMVELRNYQEIFVGGVADSYRTGTRAVLGVLPTGGGKTVCFSYITARAVAKGTVTWLVSHRIELMRQASATLTRFGIKHGLVNPAYTPNPFATVQVGTVGTFITRMHRLPPPDFIIIDEAHHTVRGNQWGKILEAYPKARILGVTATPIRTDGKGLADMYEVMVKGPGTAELIEMGYLVQPRVFVPVSKFDRDALMVKRSGDFSEAELSQALDRPGITGDAVEWYTKLAPGAPAIYHCVSVKHAQHVAEAFRAAGYRAEAVSGDMEDHERSRILSGLGDGSVQVVSFCDVISEGTDIPAIVVCGMLRPTESESLYLQVVGRALRTLPGKAHAIIIDHVGNTARHGPVHIERHWELLPDLMRQKRESAGTDTVKIVVCTQCFAAFEPQPACPYCGHEVPKTPVKVAPAQKEGELVELAAGQLEDIRKKARMEVGMARDLNDLILIQNSRGYKPGWAHSVYAARRKKDAALAATAALRAKSREELEAIAQRYSQDSTWVAAAWAQKRLTTNS